MREALGGRAAAYEDLKQYPLARADLNTLVMLNETALLAEKDAKQAYSPLNLEEAVSSHRQRGKFLAERGQDSLAKADLNRALELEGQVSLKPRNKTNSWIRLVNELDREVTVIVEKEKYTLKAKEDKKFRLPPGPYTYEVPGIVSPRKVNLEDGKMNTIRVYPPEK